MTTVTSNSVYGEGVPKVLIEAAACGRAIVTTDQPGCRDIVRHDYNGLLVPARDVDALAAALERLLRDRALREQMGARGRALVEAEFSLDIVVRQTLEIYRALVDPAVVDVRQPRADSRAMTPQISSGQVARREYRMRHLDLRANCTCIQLCRDQLPQGERPRGATTWQGKRN